MATYNGHNEDASGNILLSIGNGMTATLETGTTASQAYTKGAYLYYNNRLCKVTAAIASGNTLTIGTNIAYTTLGEELTSHLKATNGDEFYFDYKDGEPGYYPSASKTASEFVPIGGTSETTLWINSSPTSDQSGNSSMTLSASTAGYSVIRFYYKPYKTSSAEYYVDFPIELYINSKETNNHPVVAITAYCSDSRPISRPIYYVNDTTVKRSQPLYINKTGANNSYCIITKICGLK